MKFVKMHGIGNAYVFMDCFRFSPPENPAALAVEISKPQTGVGADGLILLTPCEGADACMRIYNKDGSEGEMCGNGIRCAGKYLYDSGIARKDTLYIKTGCGLKALEMHVEGGVAVGARVDMGAPIFAPEAIPVKSNDNRVLIDFPDHSERRFFCLNIGNPHAVCVGYLPNDAQFYQYGAFVEKHPLFPKRANVGFCQSNFKKGKLDARVWERGSGATLACGTGACACLVASVCEGACVRRAYVRLPGGELFIEWSKQDEHVYMTGPAEVCFTGEWTPRINKT